MIGNKQKGVTLIEMIVAATVFSIVFTASIGVFTSAIKIQKYNLNQHQLLNQTAYVIEYVSRALRMAQKDELGTCITIGKNYEITAGGTKIEFLNHDGDCQVFFWDVSSGQIKISNNGLLMFNVPLTSSKYIVKDLNFSLIGDTAGDDLQPRVTFFIDIESRELEDKPRVKLQTSVSQRNLDQ